MTIRHFSRLLSSVLTQAHVPAIERIDPALDAVLDLTTEVRQLASGFVWSDGPVWMPATGELLFSDGPKNVIHAWNARTGVLKWGHCSPINTMPVEGDPNSKN